MIILFKVIYGIYKIYCDLLSSLYITEIDGVIPEKKGERLSPLHFGASRKIVGQNLNALPETGLQFGTHFT